MPWKMNIYMGHIRSLTSNWKMNIYMGHIRSLTRNCRSHVYTIAAAGTKTAWEMERFPARKHPYSMTLFVSIFVAVLYDECCKLSVSAVFKERSLIISVLFLTLWKLSGNLWSHYSVPARLTARRQRLSCSAQPIFGEGWQPVFGEGWQPDLCVCVWVCGGGGCFLSYWEE